MRIMIKLPIAVLLVMVSGGCAPEIAHQWDTPPARASHERKGITLLFSPDARFVCAVPQSDLSASPPQAMVFDQLARRVTEATDDRGVLSGVFKAVFPGVAVQQTSSSFVAGGWPNGLRYGSAVASKDEGKEMTYWIYSSDGALCFRTVLAAKPQGGWEARKAELWRLEGEPQELWEVPLPAHVSGWAFFLGKASAASAGRILLEANVPDGKPVTLDQNTGAVVDGPILPARGNGYYSVDTRNQLLTFDNPTLAIGVYDWHVEVISLATPGKPLVSISPRERWKLGGVIEGTRQAWVAGDGKYLITVSDWRSGWRDSLWADVTEIYRMADGVRVWQSTQARDIAMSEDGRWLAVDVGDELQIGRFVERPEQQTIPRK
jgi:hypothetical protein